MYPDTTVWIKDYAYSMSLCTMIIFFWQTYGDYPVVGVKWTQAQAFVNGELKKNSYIIKQRTG
jgi:hypothetical protein